jgi:hypothetical protein
MLAQPAHLEGSCEMCSLQSSRVLRIASLVAAAGMLPLAAASCGAMGVRFVM